jgi:hypothetical protein
MAVVAGVDPARIGAVVSILSRTRPTRLLLAYFIGGFGMSLIVGAVVLFVLRDVGIGKNSSVPPEIEIAVGVLALLVAALTGTGLAARLRDQAQARHPKAGTGQPATRRAAPESRPLAAVRAVSAWLTGVWPGAELPA